MKEARILVQTLKCIKFPVSGDCRVLKDSMDLDVLAGAMRCTHEEPCVLAAKGRRNGSF